MPPTDRCVLRRPPTPAPLAASPPPSAGRPAVRPLVAPRPLVTAAALLAALALPVRAPAQGNAPPPDFVFSAPFTPADGFGRYVATDGTVIVALDSSHVAFYARTGTWPSWALQDHFALGSATAASVAVDGERAVVGETGALGAPAGAVHVYRRSGTHWVEEALLGPGDGMPGDLFGSSVDLDGSTLVVGAPSHGTGGAAYVFTRDGLDWTERAVLAASDAQAGDAFGGVVALAGGVLAISATGADVGPLGDAGVAYVFTGAGASWTEQAQLTEPVGQPGGNFGASLDADGDTVLVGSPKADTAAGAAAGAAYAFAPTCCGWALQGQLAPPFPYVQDFAAAGFSVALQGDEAVLGAPFSEYSDLGPAEPFRGLMCVFGRTGSAWSFTGIMGSPTVMSGDVLGWSVALGLDTTVGGAPGWGVGGGSIHVFSVGQDMPPWLDLGYGLEGAAGVPRLMGDGALTPGSPGSLALSNAAPGAPALLLVSPLETPLPFKGGTLVPLPATLATAVLTDGGGGVVLRWTAFPSGLPFWTEFCTQVAVADAGAPHGIALSNALAGITQ